MKDEMYKSDLIISKPGGLITAESTALGKPLILIEEGYGQEKGNIDYITNNRAGISLENVNMLANTVNKIFTDNSIATMSFHSKKIGKPQAGNLILNRIKKLID